MKIAEIVRKNDERRGRRDVRKGAYERGLQARWMYSEFVAGALLAAVKALRDPALGEAVRLPIAGKPTETGVFIECEGLVRLTLHCVIRADPNGIAYCSAIDLGMSRGGRVARCSFEPMRGTSGFNAELGVTDKQFAIEGAKFLKAIESLAHSFEDRRTSRVYPADLSNRWNDALAVIAGNRIPYDYDRRTRRITPFSEPDARMRQVSKGSTNLLTRTGCMGTVRPQVLVNEHHTGVLGKKWRLCRVVKLHRCRLRSPAGGEEPVADNRSPLCRPMIAIPLQSDPCILGDPGFKQRTYF